LKANENTQVKKAIEGFSGKRLLQLEGESEIKLREARKSCRDMNDFVNVVLPFSQIKKGEPKEYVPDVYRTFLEELAKRLDTFSAYSYPTRASSKNEQPGHHFGVRLKIIDIESLPRVQDEVEVFSSLSPDIPLKAGDKIVEYFSPSQKKWITMRGLFEKYRGSTDLNDIFLSNDQAEINLKIRSEEGLKEVRLTPWTGDESPPVARARAIGDIIHAEVLNFHDGAADQLRSELLRVREEMRSDKKEVAGVVLDFRFNSGGFDDESGKLISLFIKEGMIWKKVERSTTNIRYSGSLNLPRSMGFFDEPLVMLVNRFSISNGEMTPYLLRDAGRGLVVGEKTFGKGVNQRFFNFDVGSLIGGRFKITTTMTFGRSGKGIQGEKLSPDFNMSDDSFLARIEDCRLKKNCPVMSIQELSGLKNSPLASHPNIEPFDDRSKESGLKAWMARAQPLMATAADKAPADDEKLHSRILGQDYVLRAGYDLIHLHPNYAETSTP